MRRIQILIGLLVLLSTAQAISQEKEKWERVYTLEDATIAINATRVEFSEEGFGRVQFRWNFSKPQSVDATTDAKYKARVETIEFNCGRRRYRPMGYTLYDSRGKAVLSSKPEQPEEWRFVKAGGMMERLLGPACKLIEEKKP